MSIVKFEIKNSISLNNNTKIKNNAMNLKKYLIKVRNDYDNRRAKKIYKELFTDDNDIFDDPTQIEFI